MQHLIARWRALWDPAMYHGWGNKKAYFEGWYFKVVDPAERSVLAIIPGIAFDPDGQAHAFVQVLDGVAGKAHYHQFPADAFRPSTRGFALDLETNHFSASEIRLSLPGLSGKLSFAAPHPWPRSWRAPGVMGWYSFVPFMECYHGIVSMDHRLQGILEINGQTTDFTGGKGYIEKDWGVSFPASWIWLQTNHFEAAQQPVSLFASVAKIPWLGSHFTGYLAGFLCNGTLYRFTTYTGASLKAQQNGRTVHLTFSDRRYRLEIQATQSEGAELFSPVTGSMTGKVNESMQAHASVRFFDGGALLFEGTGRNAGMELAGAVGELLTAP